MFDCTPPPAPLMQAVVEATRVASHYVAPLAIPRVCMTTMPKEFSGFASEGVVWFDRSDPQYHYPAHTWRRGIRATVMHEVLHQFSMDHWYGGEMDEWDRQTEEGIVSTVTLDLTPHLEKNLGVYTKRVSMGVGYIPTGYRPYAARVYTHGWTGPRGRKWRARLVAADPATRKEMVNTAP